jgi:uncharacterized protein YbjQ (UPF0145 family)
MSSFPRTGSSGNQVLISTTDELPNLRITEHYGIVSGSTVRAKHFGRDMFAGIKNIFGGELKGYTELMEESRIEATQRMLKQAEALGANAVIGVRFATSSIAQGAAEIYVYGTAVRVG